MKSFNIGVTARNTPFGSYDVKGGLSLKTTVPSAYGQVDSIAFPEMQYDQKGNVRIKHREYVGDVFSDTNVYSELLTLLANPTVASTFPWLAGVARNFDKFCLEKFCVHYVTQSPTSSAGSLMIIPIYDIDSDAPTTKAQALTFQDSVRSPAWQECCALLPKDRLCNYKDYFTEIDPSDQKLSIPAKILIASSGASDSSPITGEIWVEYDIKLSCPSQPSLGYDYLNGIGNDPDQPMFSSGENFAVKQLYTNAKYSASKISMPVGNWLVNLIWYDDDATPQDITLAMNDEFIQSSLYNQTEGGTAVEGSVMFTGQVGPGKVGELTIGWTSTEALNYKLTTVQPVSYFSINP
jgi:hypothetical protein